jgi:zinc transporter ZupT
MSRTLPRGEGRWHVFIRGRCVHHLQVFIATAFVTCDSFMGWSVATSAVFHELAQEISDYVVLTSPAQANLKPHQALLLNFLSGTSVLLGACPLALAASQRHSTQRVSM